MQKDDFSLELHAFMTDHFKVIGAINVVTKAIRIKAENWSCVSRGSAMVLEDISSLLNFKTTEATTISTAPRPFMPKPTIADSQKFRL